MPFFKHHDDKIDELKKIPLFKDLSRQHVTRIAQQADEVRSEPGSAIMRQGHIGREFILIVEGRARVEQDGQVIGHLEAGSYLGEMSLIDGGPRTATVITEEPSTLLVVQSRAFDLLLDEVPGLQKEMLITLVGRLRQAEDALRAAHAEAH